MSKKTTSNVLQSTDMVRAVTVQIRKLIAGLPGVVHLTSEERLRVNNAANVPDAFHLTLAHVLDGKYGERLRPFTTLSSSTLRDLLEFTRAHRALASELARLERGILDTIAYHRAEIGEEGLRIYAIASHLTRPRDREDTVPFLARLKKALGRGRKRKRNPAAAV